MEGDALVEPGFLAGRVLDHEAVAVAVGVRGHEIDIEGEGNGVDEASDAAAEADFGALFADAPEEAFEVTLKLLCFEVPLGRGGAGGLLVGEKAEGFSSLRGLAWRAEDFEGDAAARRHRTKNDGAVIYGAVAWFLK
jgi:hypothetical protein